MKQFKLLIRRSSYILLLLCLWLPNAIQAQDNQPNKIPVSGKITDASGNGLPGVSLLVKGSRISTITDLNGEYSINIPDNKSILIFSSVGYTTQEITVGNRTKINISLQSDIKTLDEVVVVGYGTQKKSDVTAAVATVNVKNLEKQPQCVIQIK